MIAFMTSQTSGEHIACDSTKVCRIVFRPWLPKNPAG